MADDAIELILEGASTGIDNFEKVYDPLKHHVKRLPNPVKRFRRDRNGREVEYDDYNDYDSPPPSNSDRRAPRQDRSSRGGEEIIEESYERRMGRARSTGRDGHGGRGLDRDGRPRSYRKKHYSDSESSLSPPPRRRKSLGEQALVALGIGAGAGAAATEHEKDKRRDDRYHSRHGRESDRDYDRDRRRDWLPPDDRPRRAETFSESSQRPRAPAGYSVSNASERDLRVATRNGNPQSTARNGNSSQVAVQTRKPPGNSKPPGSSKRSSSSSSSSTSSVCSSSEDERRIKKIKGKKYLTAGLAAVATIHAAAGVYSSMEAGEKRYEEIQTGEITPAEARKKRNKARLQDLAAVGIAALGIKGAYSEWQEVRESRHEVAEQKEERAKRHEKRVRMAEREARRAREGNGGEGGYGRDRDGDRGRDGRDGRDRRDGYRTGRYGRDGYRSA